MDGGDGDDWIVAGAGGDDVISGGMGFDRLELDIGNVTANVVVSSLIGAAQTLPDGTVLSGIEAITKLTTGTGNDRFTLVSPLASGHQWYSGSGTDRAIVDYSGFSTAINFNYQGSTVGSGQRFFVYASHPTLGATNDLNTYGVEEFDITGGSGNDSFEAAAAAWVSFRGGAGDDYFNLGTTAFGVVDGGSGNDYLSLNRTGSTADEVLRIDGSAGGAFTLSDGGQVSGIERANLQTGSGNDQATFISPVMAGTQWIANGGTDRAIIDYSGFSAAINFNYQGSTVGSGQRFFVYASHPTLGATNDLNTYGVEEFDITGGSGNDSFDGSYATWVSFRGGAGDDYLNAGTAAATTISGGSGFDHLVIDRSASTTNETAWVDGLTGGSFTLSGGTTVSGIERVGLTTGSGNDLATFTNLDETRGSSWIANGGTDRAIIDYSGFSAAINFNYQGSTVGSGQRFFVYASHPTLGATNDLNTYGVEEFDITGGSGNDSFDATLSTFARLIGGAGNDSLASGGGNDSLVGGTGNDTLYGGAGSDTLDGGDGDDFLAAGSGNDSVNGGAGLDIVLINGSRTGYSVSTVSGITAVADIDLSDGDSGTSLLTAVETLRFNDQDIVLIQPVTITVNLTSGADTYLAATFDNYIVNGLAGNDRITTSSGNDTITGGTGNDTISGGAGNDRILYGTGSNGFDAVDGSSGNDDRLLATAASVTIGLATLVGIEAIDAAGFANVKILGGTTSDSFDFSAVALIGISQIDLGSGNDTIFGSAGNDTIVGGNGSDSLNGGAGNDTFTYTGTSSGYDFVDGGSGQNDRIVVTANASSIRLEAVVGIEVVDASGFSGISILSSSAANNFDLSATTLTGITAIDLGSGNDTLIGSGGSDTIIGGQGNDSLYGGNGDDLFRVGTSAGTDIYDGGVGDDRIETTANNVSLTVTGANLIDIETISAGSFTGLTLLGTSAANALNFSTMTLTGVTRINGGSGNDTITGSAGNDVLEGGAGKDLLTGGLGADYFDFNLSSHSRATVIDRIMDFAKGEDIIDLATIDADGTQGALDTFLFIGAAAFSGVAGQLRCDSTSLAGVNRSLADLDGNRSIDFEIQLTGTHLLTATDFML